MNLYKLIFIIGLSIVITGCSKTEIGEFTPDTAPQSTIDTPNTNIEGSPVSYTDTTNWSKFSFSNFSIYLPKDFQVNGMNNNQTEISFANFALTPGKTYNPKSDKNHFAIKIILTKPHTPISDSDLKIKDMSAGKSSQEGKTVISISNSDQDTNYQLIFDFDFATNPDLIDRIIKTLDFHKRTTLQ